MFKVSHMPSLRPSATARYLFSLKALAPHFNGLALDSIGRSEIAGFISTRKAKVSDTTVRRDLACASSVMSRAVNAGWIDTNIFKAMDTRSLKRDIARVRFLTEEEFQVLLTHAPADMVALIVLAVETGLRLGELTVLLWSDIRNGEIYVRDSKNSEPRVVPLSDIASAQLSAHPKHLQSKHVFYNADGSTLSRSAIGHRFRTITKNAGIEDFTFHDLRHTFASWAVQRGADLYRLQRVLGHKWPHMTQRYAHLRSEDLRSVVQGVGTKAGTASLDFKGKNDASS